MSLIYKEITPEQATELTRQLNLSGFEIGEDGKITYPHIPVSGTCKFKHSNPGMGLYHADWHSQVVASPSGMTVFEPPETSGSYLIPLEDFASYVLLLEQSPYCSKITRICETVLGHNPF